MWARWSSLGKRELVVQCQMVSPESIHTSKLKKLRRLYLGTHTHTHTHTLSEKKGAINLKMGI
jgi:hypothetical protein